MFRAYSTLINIAFTFQQLIKISCYKIDSSLRLCKKLKLMAIVTPLTAATRWKKNNPLAVYPFTLYNIVPSLCAVVGQPAVHWPFYYW
jgi:hypothetical protein